MNCVVCEFKGNNPYLKPPQDAAPQLPPRLYSSRQALHAQANKQDNRLSKMDGRPLPKVPEEAYNRLLENQVNRGQLSSSLFL